MVEVDPEIVQLADDMQAYSRLADRNEAELRVIDDQISVLQQKRSNVAGSLRRLRKGHRKALSEWQALTTELHADALYPFVLNGSRPHEPVDDYRIAREGLLTRLHEDLDAFHDYTSQLETPSPVFATGEQRGYVGWLAPDTAASVSVKDNTHLVIPVEKGLTFWADRRKNKDITKVGVIKLHSREVCIAGLSNVLHYGEAAITQWQNWFAQTSIKKQLELWIRFKSDGAMTMPWLAPSEAMVAKWKEILYNSVLASRNGRTSSAPHNIALAERALRTDELRYTSEEREALQDLIARAKATPGIAPRIKEYELRAGK